MSIKKCCISGFLFILIMGTLAHFAYDFFDENLLLAYFVPINESPWEHLKLLFWPACVFMVYEYLKYGKNHSDFFAVKMSAMVTALGFILTFFYTYSGILGFNMLFMDILDFILASAVYFYLTFYMTNCAERGNLADSLKGIAVLFILAVCFILWTNNPPDLGMFWG